MGTTDSWHSGSRPVNPQWPLMPALNPDELLSSWLIRAAMTFGCDPKTLTQQIWPTWRVWTADPDRGYNEERTSALAAVSGVSEEAIEQAALRWIADRVVPTPPSEKMKWRWLLTLGTRGHSRKGGLQYCPHCLTEDHAPFYRVHWRLVWHVGCERHGNSLLDRCWHCDSPLEPHRLQPEDGNLAICASCGADLRQTHPRLFSEDAMAFQRWADRVIRTGYGRVLGEQISASRWFELAHYMGMLVRPASRSIGENALSDFMKEVGGVSPQDLSLHPGTPLEGLRNSDRQLILQILFRFMSSRRGELVRSLLEHGVSRQALIPKGFSPPEIIEGLAQDLLDRSVTRQARTTRLPTPRPRHEVVRMMKRLVRKVENSSL
ncbi:TniQ family protein [Ectothiorhodospira shaposhnikovii]|uniref:TniQ family protein n=1 Tax=Ectothiorhodospira shaposhnikovii TaxID=1054 RepID=UPI003B830FC2